MGNLSKLKKRLPFVNGQFFVDSIILARARSGCLLHVEDPAVPESCLFTGFNFLLSAKSDELTLRPVLLAIVGAIVFFGQNAKKVFMIKCPLSSFDVFSESRKTLSFRGLIYGYPFRYNAFLKQLSPFVNVFDSGALNFTAAALSVWSLSKFF